MQSTAALDSLQTLLTRSIDYAGLFPPASLELEPALKNHRDYLRTPESWMLSTFVLPLPKFAEAAWFISEFNERNPLRISALGPKTINRIDFVEELRNGVKGIRELAGEGRNVVLIDQLEMPLPKDCDPETLKIARETIEALPLRVFLESPADTAERIIALLAEENARTNAQPFGFKLRTGGVTADVFPTSPQIASVLVASCKSDVPVKFTAGLHHPVRMFREEVKGKMHGFLNVLGAGVLAREHGWNEEQTAAMLDDEDASSFAFEAGEFRWRDWQISPARIEQHRRLTTSFGSCSFDDPRDDLRALNLP